MPSKFTPIRDIADNACIGTRQGKKGGVWTLRYYGPTKSGKGNYYYKSLGMLFEEGRASERAARKIADAIYDSMEANAEAGVFPTLKITPDYIRQRFVADITARTERNEGLIRRGHQPAMTVEGGKGYWTYPRLKEALRFLDQMEIRDQKTGEYKFEDGAIKRFLNEECPAEISKLKQRHLNAFRDWSIKEFGWAPGTINKALSQLRAVLRFGYNNDWLSFVPSIAQQPRNLVGRKRRPLKGEEYAAIIQTTRARYEGILAKGDDNPEEVDLYYQFSLWILIMSNSGIRPPGGNEERLFLKWRDIKTEERDGEVRQYLLRQGEKAHLDYEAVILPNAQEYFTALKALQSKRKVKSEYVFAHTFDKAGPRGFSKGDPIKSFKRQWSTILKICGLDSPVGTPQGEKLVPYSLRGYFITTRAQSSDDLRIDDLAKATGTSPEIIRQIYYDFSTRKTYGSLTAGSNAREKLKPIYQNGFYMGRE